MKSLAELAEIRERMKGKIVLREGHNDVRIVVGRLYHIFGHIAISAKNKSPSQDMLQEGGGA